MLFESSIIQSNTASQSSVVWCETDLQQQTDTQQQTRNHMLKQRLQRLDTEIHIKGDKDVTYIVVFFCSFIFILNAFAMCVGVTLTQIHPDKADTR